MPGVLILTAAWAMAAGRPEGGRPPEPVVVELFTSQGCSSCPDADALISAWGGEQFNKGAVIPLSFDVDYWDYLGWRDVFSQPAYSKRQREYAEALRVGVYTPQIVVAGRTAFVGSNGETLEETVARHRMPAAAKLGVATLPSPRVRLKISASRAPKAAGRPHVMLALFENGLVTRVERGENGGRTLRNDFVVRRLRDLGELPESGEFKRSVDDPWDPSWRRENSGAAVFLQDPETKAISGAASVFPLTLGRP